MGSRLGPRVVCKLPYSLKTRCLAKTCKTQRPAPLKTNSRHSDAKSAAPAVSDLWASCQARRGLRDLVKLQRSVVKTASATVSGAPNRTKYVLIKYLGGSEQTWLYAWSTSDLPRSRCRPWSLLGTFMGQGRWFHERRLRVRHIRQDEQQSYLALACVVRHTFCLSTACKQRGLAGYHQRPLKWLAASRNSGPNIQHEPRPPNVPLLVA